MGEKETNPWSDEFLEEVEKQAEFECDAEVVGARTEKRTLNNGVDAIYLVLDLKPLSFQGDNMTKQYKIGNQKNGKWVHFQKALRACGIKGRSENEMVGIKAHWKQIIIGKFNDKDTGEEVTNTVFIPTSLLTGATATAPAKAQAIGEMSIEESKIYEAVKKSGGSLKPDIAHETGLKLSDVIKNINYLKKKGKVVEEEGVVLPK